MTSIRISGTLYALDEAITRPKLRDVKYLARASRTSDTPAVNPKTIGDMFAELGKLIESKKKFDSVEWLMDDWNLANVQGAIWLARRKAGEDLTYDEAGDIDLTDFTFEDDEVADPKAPIEDAEPQ